MNDISKLIAKYYRVNQNMPADNTTLKFYEMLEHLTDNGFEVVYGTRWAGDPIIYFALRGCPLFTFTYEHGQYTVDTDTFGKDRIENIIAGLGIAVK